MNRAYRQLEIQFGHGAVILVENHWNRDHWHLQYEDGISYPDNGEDDLACGGIDQDPDPKDPPIFVGIAEALAWCQAHGVKPARVVRQWEDEDE
jgi:hypothetical protein